MDALTVGVVAGAVTAVVGFFIGRRTGRTAGDSIGGAPARSSPSGETTEADAAFRLGLSRIGAYLRENVDGPLAAAFKDRSLSLRRAAEEAVAAIEDLHFFLEDPAGEIGEDDLARNRQGGGPGIRIRMGPLGAFLGEGFGPSPREHRSPSRRTIPRSSQRGGFRPRQGRSGDRFERWRVGSRAYPGWGSGVLCRGVVQGV